MPRQLIQERAFQEPIHEDAPGFVENTNKNLITELNQEVLPSWITDIVGPPDANPQDYQLRATLDGTLERYDADLEDWVAAGAAPGTGGGGGEDSYAPSYKASVNVVSDFSGDGFVAFDLTTDKSFSGRDIRVYQFNLLRRATVRVKARDSVAGTTTYRILTEGVLSAGANTFEVRYGDINADWIQGQDWSLEANYDFIGNPTDLDGNNFALIQFRDTPVWFPVPTDYEDYKSKFTQILDGGGTAKKDFLTLSQFSYFNGMTNAVDTPRLNMAAFAFGTAAPYDRVYPNYQEFDSMLVFRRYHTSSSTYQEYYGSAGVRTYDTPQGTLIGVTHVSRSFTSETYEAAYHSTDFIGLMNNGWLLFGTYKDQTDYKSRYGIYYYSHDPKIRTYFDYQTSWGDVPKIKALVPIFDNYTVTTQDEAL